MRVKWNGRKEIVMFLKTLPQCPAEYDKAVSRGCLEEEADFQEAIRRSLEDLRGDQSVDASSEMGNIKRAEEIAQEGYQENDRADPNLAWENDFQQNESFHEIVAGVEKPDSMGGTNVSWTMNSPERQLISSVASNSNNLEMLIDKPCERHPVCHPDLIKRDANESGNLNREIPCTESVTPIGRKEVNLSTEQFLDISNEGGEASTLDNSCLGNSSCISDSVFRGVPDAILVDANKNYSEAAPTCYLNETVDPTVSVGGSSVKPTAATKIDAELKLAEEKDHNCYSMEREHYIDDSVIDGNKNIEAEITEASLQEEMLILGQESINLGEEQRKHERNAESVSSEMFAECQELLQMFGLPFIIAPMEAEAQCAYMELANLVDGVVTDDSDVFLFGARSVYKNIFDDRKYVETYFMKDIENELGLTREKLIRMALLLGSDYTEGVSGIGIVNAIEVVNAFPEEDGLHKFREWIESPDPTILGKFVAKTGSSSRKRGSKVSDNNVSHSESNLEGVSASDQDVSQASEHEQSADHIQDIKHSFMDKHRTVSKNWHIPSSFPSEAVVSAYASPQVDKSTEPFSWGKPDLFVLRKSCWEKFGWTSQKADELLLPVLKEYNKHETQLRLEAFYTFNERFAKIRSKRIKKAVKGITGSRSSELMDDAMQEVSKSRKKRRISPSESGSEKVLNGIENSVAGNESNSIEKSPPKQSRKRKIHGKPVSSEVENPEPPMPAEGKRSTNKGSGGNRRGRGRGRGQQVGRGRRKGSPGFKSTESSSSYGNSSNDEQEVCAEMSKKPGEVRRSTRSRKPVNYAVNAFEIDDSGKSLYQNADEEAVEQETSLSQGRCGDGSGGLIEENQHKSGDPLAERGLHEDYRETGGGFCLDED
ncbi:hypothetical protein L1049_002344 [Liquidambar formosana]|uniref:XPG-I domain-containing protein n=1 Tax=Liquidambar formosana TaxID=63359 RepID=A0AAP0R6L8_LIQFO